MGGTPKKSTGPQSQLWRGKPKAHWYHYELQHYSDEHVEHRHHLQLLVANVRKGGRLQVTKKYGSIFFAMDLVEFQIWSTESTVFSSIELEWWPPVTNPCRVGTPVKSLSGDQRCVVLWNTMNTITSIWFHNQCEHTAMVTTLLVSHG